MRIKLDIKLENKAIDKDPAFHVAECLSKVAGEIGLILRVKSRYHPVVYQGKSVGTVIVSNR